MDEPVPFSRVIAVEWIPRTGSDLFQYGCETIEKIQSKNSNFQDLA
jgi:hypothetical protein